MPRVSIRKLVLLALNLVSTILTLLTGLRENPLIVLITGRYDLIRSRLLEGTINYNIIRDDLFLKDHLPDLLHVGESYRFISAPRRGPDNLGVDRSLCMRVNSYNATVMNLNFDDFWGYGPRRNQMYHFSISAPHCDVINILPSWYNATCIYAIGGGNESICGQYIFDHFETLADNRVILALSESDTGALGIPFLRCRGRSEKAFGYITDLMCDQSYWAGGSYHVEIQSSRCLANPVVRSPDWKYTLFKVASADKTAEVVMGIDNTGWFVTIVSILYGIVTIWMIVHGILAAILQSRHAEYVPQGVRFLHEWRIFKVILPFMPIATHAPHGENRVISFKGVTFMASDVWMNHWLYISLSMLEAVSTIRTTYIIFQMGTWMLGMKITTQNFIFTCGAVTKITWIICLVHSVLRWMCKLGLNSIKKLKLIRSRTREQLEWYVDAVAMLTSYKIYSLLLCLVLYIMLKLRKTTTLMVRQVPYKHGVWGGDANLARFWGSEIVCDLIVTVSLVLGSGIVLSSFTLLTKYRHITRNSFLRVLQTRFFVVGWDVYVALEALGMDPFDPTLVEDGICKTSCSIGAVLQQFYTSGMSGHVNLAGDHIFTENGFSKEVPKLRYSIKKATAMGLCDFKRSRSGASTTGASNAYKVDDRGSHNEPGASQLASQSGTEDQDAHKTMSFIKTKSLFDRKLKIVTEGYFGKILIIDEEDAGRAVKAKTSTAMEFEVNELLSVLSIMDIKPLLGTDKKLHIR